MCIMAAKKLSRGDVTVAWKGLSAMMVHTSSELPAIAFGHVNLRPTKRRFVLLMNDVDS